MEAISVGYLLAIGILLVGLEALIFSFVLFFIGIGFIIVALISQFYLFENLYVQIALAFVIALVIAYFFRGRLLEKISKPSSTEEEKPHKSGIGVVEKGMIKFEGTYWNTLDDIASFNDGERVKVIDVVDNRVVLDI